MNVSNRIVATAFFFVAACLPFSASAQAHQIKEDRYTLRSSTVSSETLPASMTKAHGFEQKPGLSILNVTVFDNGRAGNGTVPAALAIRIHDLVGRAVPIDMRMDRENGYVSYYGTYRRVPHHALSFVIRATPQGTDRTLTLRYRDR